MFTKLFALQCLLLLTYVHCQDTVDDDTVNSISCDQNVNVGSWTGTTFMHSALVKVDAKPNKVITTTREYSSYPSIITKVVAKTTVSGSKACRISGGPGDTSVKIRFYSAKGKRIDYTMDIGSKD